MYSDGTVYNPFGTTCYASVYQSDKTISDTLESLKNAPFNKIRILMFPKYMSFNTNEPKFFPFLKNNEGKWDFKSPDLRFWNRLESLLGNLDNLGIEADLILFHPYDKWGFSDLSRNEAIDYIDYCVDRLSSFKNIWWSLANEYEMLLNKTYADWDMYAEEIIKRDVYGRLRSIHNFCNPYPKRNWMTHCSIQNAFPEHTIIWREAFELPVIVDECGYEGNLEFNWGNISAFELINRFWKGIVRGGYCSHGETFYHKNEIIWWAKGGKLEGKSISRIAFLKKLLEEIGNVDPVINFSDLLHMDFDKHLEAIKCLTETEQYRIKSELVPWVCGNEKYKLYYYGNGCPKFVNVNSLSGESCRAEIIDIWDMTRTIVNNEFSGDTVIELPAKEGMAVLLTKL